MARRLTPRRAPGQRETALLTTEGRRKDDDDDDEGTMGPLTGLKVLDLTHVMAGPTCTLMLADMGADVIKVEKNPGGDDTRRMIPPRVGTEAASFLMMNRNKRGIVVDLKKPGGAKVLRRLAERADVLVENFGPGVMERLGFGYEDLRKANPGLIYCSLSGFGRTGPYKDRRGFDLVAQAMSGIMTFTGDGPDSPPSKCGPPLSDITAGIIAAMGILAAYTHRLKTGEGQWVETSLFEAALVQTYWQSAIALATGVAPRAMGSAHPLNAPYQAFHAADGWIVVGGANQKNWLRVLEAIGAPELADDPRFAENAGRMAHLKELEAELDRRFRTKPSEHWLTALEAKGVPCGPVYDMLQALADPQTAAREMVVEVEHSTAGRVKTIGLPVKFSETPGKVRTGAPVYGEHTEAVLRDYGFGEDEIAALQQEGAVVAYHSEETRQKVA
jgi:crotonobetainyl-CoA:carnitine CoA-transferase CaiB-like acyl-CoA transferase